MSNNLNSKLKILLIGDYSHVHSYLRKQLLTLGYSVTLVSDGDWFKNTYTDYSLPKIKYDGINIKKFINRYKYVTGIFRIFNKIFKDQYDIIQFINPQIITYKKFNFLNKFIWKKALDNSKNIYCMTCGYDAITIRGTNLQKLFENIKIFDLPSNYSLFYEDPQILQDSIEYFSKIKLIIPTLSDYYLPYMEYNSTSQYQIPITRPINIAFDDSAFSLAPPHKEAKLIVWHAINRKGAKGYNYIKPVFDKLSREFNPEKVEFQIIENMPYNEFIKFINSFRGIFIEQVFLNGLGMSSLSALLCGHIICGGAVEEPHSGQINFTHKLFPDIELNYKIIKELVQKALSNIEAFYIAGENGRNYVLTNHNLYENTLSFLQIWQKINFNHNQFSV